MSRIGKALNETRFWLRTTGLRGTSAWATYRVKRFIKSPNLLQLKIKPRQARYPVSARLGESSDMEVFAQIYQQDEYACLRDLQSPRVIFDLGANVGFASAYFLSCFPASRVLSLEPDPHNYRLCQSNLAPYGNRSRLILGAAWSECGRLCLSRGTFGDGREWATEVVASNIGSTEATVQAYDIPSLLKLIGENQIDLLKIDIEGSELALFGSSSSKWIPLVRNICIELHGVECEQKFFGALRNCRYDLSRSGELTICRNIRPVTN
jgi:FkbM family methyltransferase